MSNEPQNLNKTTAATPDPQELQPTTAPMGALAVVAPVTDENTGALGPDTATAIATDADANAHADAHAHADFHAEVGTELADMQPVSMQPAIDLNEAKRGLEAALLAASEPMPLQELKKIFEGELNGDILRNLLDELRLEWSGRSVELAIVASGYRFRVKPDYQKYIDRLANEKPPKYSRAVLETMAIIAYRQPVTRSDIEDIRGVTVSPHILKTLEDRGWIDEIGHKDAPGRPALFATSKHFLDDLNLVSLDQLPPLHELQATLDMSPTDAALPAGTDTLALPGVAAGEAREDADQSNPASDTSNLENAKDSDTDTDKQADIQAQQAQHAQQAPTANQNAVDESAGHPHENHSQEQEPGATS